MTFTQIIKDIFSKKPRDVQDNANKGSVKAFMSKLSGAFMLPISIMAVAGLFLGVGAAISSQTSAGTFGLFIKNLGDPIFGAMPALFLIAIIIAFTEEAGVAVFAGLVAFLVFNGLQTPFIETKSYAGSEGNLGTAKFLGINTSIAIQERMFKIVGTNLGIQSLDTSIFGGIIVGFIAAWLYNKFYQIQLPQAIAFFGGKRFVAIVNIIMMIPLVFIFLLIWPWIGLGFAYFGEYSGKVMGLDSFVFGFIERSLVPFGLHHVFYAPLWWTSAGGDIATQFNEWTNDGGAIVAINGVAKTSNDFYNSITATSYQGDSFGWLAVNGSGVNNVTYTINGGAEHTEKVFPFIADQLDIRYGRFMQGKFSFMQLGLPAAAVAMVLAAPKENRKEAFSICFPAALTSFLTGVTEPIEFTFLFLAPLLFWGFHAFMAALSFLLMNLFGAHVGMTFSGGFIDAIIYGMIPYAQGTNFYWMYVIGIVYAPIYFFVFYWYIKRFNLETPGRGSNVRLMTKADYQKRKAANKSVKGKLNAQEMALVSGLGGWDNITKYANCASRLRYNINSKAKVDEAALKSAGAFGVRWIGTKHIQLILGPKSEQINSHITSNIGTPLNTENTKLSNTPKEVKRLTKAITLKAPIENGKITSLSSLNDGVFSKKMLGDGVVAQWDPKLKNGTVLAPISGTVVSTFPTNHAYGIKTDEGVEILIHIGVDTVNLKGKGFTSFVKQNQKIKRGEKLAEVDLSYVKAHAPNADCIIVITSPHKVSKHASGNITTTKNIFNVE